MAFQVGASCFATVADAGRAACSQFQPATTIAGTIFKSVTCYDYNITTGALYLRIATTDTSIPSTTFQNVSHLMSFPTCVQQDYIDAAEIIVAGVLALWVIWYSGKKIIDFLGWSRGDNA